jgi:DNA-directed RNA polymerase subunit RPC12/RpoP
MVDVKVQTILPDSDETLNDIIPLSISIEEIKPYKCSRCKEFFSLNQVNTYPGYTRCKKCDSLRHKVNTEKTKEKNKDINPFNDNETKYCFKCKQNLLKTPLNWLENKGRADGLNTSCRKCTSIISANIRYNRYNYLKDIYGTICLCCGSKDKISYDHVTGKKYLKDQFNNNIRVASITQLRSFNIDRNLWYLYLTSHDLKSILIEDYKNGILHDDIKPLCVSCNSSKDVNQYCLIHQKKIYG